MSCIARKFDKQVDVVGNGQCVTLVKTFSGAPAASLWREGEKLTRSSVNTLAAGTVSATFVKGRYPNRASGNHAAVFVRTTANGIVAFDQWRGHKPAERSIFFGRGTGVNVAQRPELYSVVE